LKLALRTTTASANVVLMMMTIMGLTLMTSIILIGTKNNEEDNGQFI
jgi:hypothetical protein